MHNFKFSDCSGIEIGLSGHYGQTRSCYTDHDCEWDSYSVNCDLVLTVSPKIKIVSEMFTGKNLAEYWGGIKQGINVSGDMEIGSKGYYINLLLSPHQNVDLSLAYGVDDPDDETLAVGNRSKNTSMVVNMWYKFNPKLLLGFEVLRLKTDYLGLDKQATSRFEFLVMYIF